MARPKRLETRACENCGVEVTRKPCDFRDHTFCSHRCYSKSDYRREMTQLVNLRLAPKVTVRCLQCGDDYELPPSKVPGSSFCSRECHQLSRRTRQVNKDGYILVFIGKGQPGASKSGHILEHRKVMQDTLGRALWPDENVHHLNGVRDDNRPENLELWSRSQPCGQRVVDKIRWAREFLERYADTPLEEASDGCEEGNYHR